MKKPWQKWVVPLGLAVVLAALVERQGVAAHFVRVPIGNGPAPEWSMPDLKGGTVVSSNFIGRVLVLNFWATWCPPCREEIPQLNSFYDAHRGEGLEVVGAAVDDEGVQVVRPFAEKNHLRYPVVLADARILSRFGAPPVGSPGGGSFSLPTTVVIDRQGRYAARYLGGLTQAELEKVTQPLLHSVP